MAKLAINSGFMSVLVMVVITVQYDSGTFRKRSSDSIRPAYKVTNLGTLGGDKSSACDINNASQIVGTSSCSAQENVVHAFLWHGKMRDIGVLDAVQSIAHRINPAGEIVGYIQYGNSLPLTKAFRCKAGKLTTLPALPGLPASEANAINDSGSIVGLAGRSGARPTAVMWADGGVREIGIQIGARGSGAQAINNHNDIVGIVMTASARGHAYLVHQGKMRDLGTLNGDLSYANSINDRGEVAGYSQTKAQNFHACLWRKGGIVDLGALIGPESEAYGINQSGQVVGASGAIFGDGPAGGFRHAVLWENGRCVDLNTHIGRGTGWRLDTACGINDRGQIVGIGYLRGLWWPSLSRQFRGRN